MSEQTIIQSVGEVTIGGISSFTKILLSINWNAIALAFGGALIGFLGTWLSTYYSNRRAEKERKYQFQKEQYFKLQEKAEDIVNFLIQLDKLYYSFELLVRKNGTNYKLLSAKDSRYEDYYEKITINISIYFPELKEIEQTLKDFIWKYADLISDVRNNGHKKENIAILIEYSKEYLEIKKNILENVTQIIKAKSIN